MYQIKRIGIDTSKAVFTLHCVDDTGGAVLQTNLRRAQLAAFSAILSPGSTIILSGFSSMLGWVERGTGRPVFKVVSSLLQ